MTTAKRQPPARPAKSRDTHRKTFMVAAEAGLDSSGIRENS